MQTIGPYTLRDLLGAGAAGRVWRAYDQQGGQVTMAVLEGPAANDPQRRWQFSTTVEQARQSSPAGAPVAADLVGQVPWVAYHDDGGATAANIFAAMGVPCEPVAAPTSGVPGPVSAAPASGQPMQQPPQPGPQQPVPGQPLPTPVSGMPVSGQPMSAQPQPTDDEPPTTMLRPGAEGFAPPQQQVPPQVPQQGFGPGEHPGPGFAEAEPANPFEPVDPFNANGGQAPADPFSPQQPQPQQAQPPQQQPFQPQPDPFQPRPEAFQQQAQQPQPDANGYPQQPPQYPAQNRFDDEPPPKKSRKGLLVVLIVVVLVVLAGGVGGAVYFTQGGKPDTKPTAGPKPSGGSATKQGQPTPQTQKSAPSTPKQPGKEPPKNGSWPASFAKFGSGDKAKQQADLAGLGFTFSTPGDWTCTKRDQSTTYVNYHCGSSKTKAGGDVIVRTCGEPCDPAKKIKMRQDEEAFGLQWVRDGGNSSWAEGKKVAVPSGGTGYGLVLVRYWHSKPGGPMDRQVVVRLTGPTSSAKDLQKVENSVRDATQ
ncbi:hypothetical protein [Actinocatenispora rupis]|uniref:Serine/threonine protein kinase n=1 Tax=Actinocatenispora rupis TaxID=519421 RepID=A0A8J3NDF2_9ACTN|nr:hypothetical protein [Actinocatenispora rupis]GID12860.1 hypothetical protein Aru02nite_37490 [Actinocatenispora rupis]